MLGKHSTSEPHLPPMPIPAYFSQHSPNSFVGGGGCRVGGGVVGASAPSGTDLLSLINYLQPIFTYFIYLSVAPP